MAPLPSDLRKTLENKVIAAREAAEAAARAALVTLAVERPEAFPTMSEEQKALRRGLRAKARQLGGGNLGDGAFGQLIEEIAYQQWHRMLFARFLAENNLLMHPAGVALTLQDCADLAADEGAADAWELAARYANRMLPGIFLADDPTAQVRFAPESRHALEKLAQDLPAAVFTADDALGWVYQFWQAKKKDEVNKSERKIGGADLYPVTQLFTEDYMVRFLLENSLGAWWAARHPESPLVKTFSYLRFLDDAPRCGAWAAPAAGTFPGWPERAAEVTVMDPCGGSGHFIAAAFDMLRRMRMEEEGLGEAEAGEAAIRDNLFMLEIDPRCTQIAAFALVFAAWKAGGYRALPVPNIACSGIAVEGQLEDWLKLANGDSRLRTSLERLYNLFRQAPTLGSLIDPAHVPEGERMWSAEYDEVAPLLVRALARELANDPVTTVTGTSVQGVARAAKMLAGKYTLVATNVPYLGRGRQDPILTTLADSQYADGKNDLATIFLIRCLKLSVPHGTVATVLPQNWLFLKSYERLRRRLLADQTWCLLAQLGPGAFSTIGGEVVKAITLVFANAVPASSQRIPGISTALLSDPEQKAQALRDGPINGVLQVAQLKNPDARVSLEQQVITIQRLSRYADSYLGLGTGDFAHYGRCFWELPAITYGWAFQQGTVTNTLPFGGLEHIVSWDRQIGRVRGMPFQEREQIHNQDRSGRQAWGKVGVCISLMTLRATLYMGEVYDKGLAVVVPKEADNVKAIWAFCSSALFGELVRSLDQNIIVASGTLVKVPFDLRHWQETAEQAYPDGLPQRHSDDPTQWLFEGHPTSTTAQLQVAVACLLGYHWPQQKPDNLDGIVDNDGIICLPPVAGEQPAAERLRSLLAAAYGDAWSLALQQQLLAEAGYKDRDLADWLRDGFFEQHCRLFHNRPFIWQIWDGRKDGFAALVNYHKLDAANLDTLIYTYLGNWIETQRAQAGQGVAGADGRLVAGLELKKKLELIRDGEPPYDIYVRWKALAEQPIGWNPDLNDGVRLNIRPFVTAGVLRSKFTINWNKDRGKNPDGSERFNDRHYTRREKVKARGEAQGQAGR